MIKVLHVTPGLDTAGAETLLTQLVGTMDRDRFANVVISLTDEGQILGRSIREQGIPLQALQFSRGIPNPALVHKLAEEIKRHSPSIVHTWMYHASIVGSLSCALAGRPKLVWGLHTAKVDPANVKRMTLQMIRLGKHMSRRFPSRITCSSDAARAAHVELGYAVDKLQTISNGIDTRKFAPNAAGREVKRQELGIAPDAPVVGMVARFMKVKDHATFFRAAGIIHKRRPQTRFVLCGTGVTKDNALLWSYVTDAGVQDATQLLGLSSDTDLLNTAFDVATCSSASAESFCIALGEAMACGVPCVTTNMEGPAALVGDTGIVVPIGDAEAMATAWETLIDLSPAARADVAERSRNRVVEHFSLTSMVRQYEDLYSNLCGDQ